jgi:hypothetical protein
MDSYPREKLAELVRGEGADLVQDARRVRALLEDVCPGARREVAALVAAVEENVPIRIERSSDSLSAQAGQERLSRMLAQNRALTAGAASWAVQSWAWALGKGPAPADAAEAAVAAVSDPGMQATPREKLRELSRTYGPDLLQDPRRVKGLIQDVAPGYRREQAVLVAALEEGIPQRVARSGPAPAADELARLAGTLSQQRALTDAAALWAVQSWAWALGKGAAPADRAATPEPPPAPPPPVENGARTRTPTTEGVTVGGRSEEAAGRGGNATPPPPRTYQPWPSTPPPEPRGPKRSRLPVVLTAVGAIVALVAVLVLTNRDEPYYPPSTFAPTVTTEEPPATEPEPTETAGSPGLAAIQETFVTPSDSCSEYTGGEVPEGAEYRLLCTVSGVDVLYIKWDSVASMNRHFDRDQYLTDYEESNWHFDATPDVDEGRLIEFVFDDGDRGLDWTYEDQLLSGEAYSDTTQAELKEWWRSKPMR